MADERDTWEANGPFRRILVGWDASESSTHAFGLAAQLARCCNAELLVISVARIPDHVESQDERDGLIAAARQFYNGHLMPLERVATRAGITFRHEVVSSGQRPETIITYAREHAVDLIVLGAHKGGGGFARLLTGMVGEAVSRAAPCPVLLVPYIAN
ncbi:MAG: universal stress protein [Chloroflexi bacterium]|nr:universal stress protein [Chloroflexota bacterium]